jgi:nucleotide-binding universal stress UspA family protein
VTVRTVPSGRVGTDRPFAAVDEAVAPVLEQARRSGVEARHSVEFAEDSGSGLAGAAKAIDALSVVVATHARHGLDRLLEGSDSLELVHRSTCPVILVHHDEASV